MQIYNHKGDLIRRPTPEDYAESFANCFETEFDKEPDLPESYDQVLEAGFSLLESEALND